LGLDGPISELWNTFVQKFKSRFITLKVEDDSLVWSKNPMKGEVHS
jgi:hypothetical protein